MKAIKSSMFSGVTWTSSTREGGSVQRGTSGTRTNTGMRPALIEGLEALQPIVALGEDLDAGVLPMPPSGFEIADHVVAGTVLGRDLAAGLRIAVGMRQGQGQDRPGHYGSGALSSRT